MGVAPPRIENRGLDEVWFQQEGVHSMEWPSQSLAPGEKSDFEWPERTVTPRRLEFGAGDQRRVIDLDDVATHIEVPLPADPLHSVVRTRDDNLGESLTYHQLLVISTLMDNKTW